MKRWGVVVGLALFGLAVTGSALAYEDKSITASTHAGVVASGSVTYDVWSSIPLPTGVTTSSLSALAVSPVDAYTIFLGASQGLFKSVNAGQSWTRVATGTVDSYAFDVQIASSNAQRLYVNSWSLYRSDNGGASWSPLPSPPSNCGMTIAPSNANRVYVRACNGGGTGPALFRSDDGVRPGSRRRWPSLNPSMRSPLRPPSRMC